MAFLGAEKKCDLINLAKKMGELPEPNITYIGLKNIITKNDAYEEKFVKALLSMIVSERKDAEKKEAEQREKEAEQREKEAERREREADKERREREADKERELEKIRIEADDKERELEKIRIEAKVKLERLKLEIEKMKLMRSNTGIKIDTNEIITNRNIAEQIRCTKSVQNEKVKGASSDAINDSSNVEEIVEDYYFHDKFLLHDEVNETEQTSDIETENSSEHRNCKKEVKEDYCIKDKHKGLFQGEGEELCNKGKNALSRIVNKNDSSHLNKKKKKSKKKETEPKVKKCMFSPKMRIQRKVDDRKHVLKGNKTMTVKKLKRQKNLVTRKVVKRKYTPEKQKFETTKKWKRQARRPNETNAGYLTQRSKKDNYKSTAIVKGRLKDKHMKLGNHRKKCS